MSAPTSSPLALVVIGALAGGCAPTGTLVAVEPSPGGRTRRYSPIAQVCRSGFERDPGPAQALATRMEKERPWAVAIPGYRDRVPIE